MRGNPLPSIRLIDLGQVEPWQTQAVYHAIAETMTEETPDTIILCRPNAPYLCLGYHQVFENVLDPKECEKRNLPVFRRRVGGGTTYLDENQLFYQCIFHNKRVPINFQAVFARLLAAPVMALRSLGLDAALYDINEIEVCQKRIAGVGGGRIGEACVVVGNLLFDFNFETMAAVWHVPWESFRALAVEAMRERITTLHDHFGTVKMHLTEKILLAAFAECLERPLERGSLTPNEMDATQRMKHILGSPEYIGWNPVRDATPNAIRALKISARSHIHAGEIRVNGFQLRGSFHLNQEIIQRVILESDPPREWRLVEEQLHGLPFHEWQNQLATH